MGLEMQLVAELVDTILGYCLGFKSLRQWKIDLGHFLCGIGWH